jgi:hypothetical protein
MSEENNCVFVCSHGILKSCDFQNDVKPFSIYVCNNEIREFIQNTLPNITQHFVLVSGDSDDSVPFDIFPTVEEFESFIQHPLLIRWYSQNCTISDHPKMVQMPIGLDYHTLSNPKQRHPWGEYAPPIEQEAMLMSMPKTSPRIPKAYCNFQFTIHHSKFGKDRHDAIRNFPADLTYYEPRQTTREHAWQTQCNYAFVLSPHGNGLDCHRTWEALCLGCIPIVKTSALDPMYAGLPVLILNEWSDGTAELLAQKIDELTPLFDTDVFKNKMQLNYWMERIRRDVLSYTHTMNNSVWDNADKQNYNAHVGIGAGQIDRDEFAADIELIAANTDYRTYLEVGTWNGRGSTMAFSRGFKKGNRYDDYVFYSLECNADKCRDAQQLHAGNPKIHILNEVVWNEEPADFYEVFPQCLTDSTLKHWNEVDLANMKKCPVFLTRPELPAVFDVVLLDGGEFTTYFEFKMLKDRCRMLLLDDTNVDKCKRIVEELKADPAWEILKEVNVRNGYLIAKKL